MASPLAALAIVAGSAIGIATAIPIAGAEAVRQQASTISIAPAGAAPERCTVKLLARGTDRPSSHPCGVAIRVSRGQYCAWIETADRISREIHEVDVRQGAVDQHLVSPLVPASKIEIRAKGLDPLFTLALIHSSMPFRREISLGSVENPVLMPAGSVIAAVFNRRDQVDTISRPVDAAAGSTAVMDVSRQNGSAVVALLELADGMEPHPFAAVTTRPAGRRAADLLVARGRQFLGVWYGLEAGPAGVTVESEDLFIQPVATTIAGNRVSTVRATLRLRPTVTLRVDASEAEMRELTKTKAMLRIVAERDGRVLAERPIDRAEHRFERMPAEIVNAVVQVGSWSIRHRIDLTAGVDTDTTLEIEAIEVAGRITYGDDPAAARIQFRSDDQSAEAQTDDTGRYETVLWQTGRFICEVWLRDQPSVPSSQDTFWIDTDTSTLDFRIPRTNYRVAVLDAEAGTPIARASVGFLNRWEDPAQGRRAHGHAVFTNDRGIATLPPLRAGEVEVHASAAGYLNPEPIRFTVPAGNVDDPPMIEIRLRPAGNGSQVRLTLPNGAAAAGARVGLFSDGIPSRELFRGSADANGAMAIPNGLEGSILLVRHPAAGPLVRRWSGSQTEPFVLPLAGGPALVQVRRTGDEPARFAAIVMWINGCELKDAGLFFLTDQPPLTDADGIWTARNLPKSSFQIVAFARSGNRQQEGLLPLATTVNAPWPATISLRLVD